METRLVQTDQLVLDGDVNIRFDLDEVTVLRYMDILDSMPAIKVIEVDGALVLADGFHRVEAALRLGRKTIFADITVGTREDAIVASALANVAHGLPLQHHEWELAVVRLCSLGHSQRDVGKMLHISQSSVSNYVRANVLRTATGTGMGTDKLAQIARAPVHHREDVVRATDEQGLTHDDIKELAGLLRADPGATVNDVLDQARPHLRAMAEHRSYVKLFEQALENVRRLDQLGITPARVAGMAGNVERLERWRKEAADAAKYMAALSTDTEAGNLRIV